MGRRTKLTPDAQRRICDALAIGATYELAAKYGGVDYVTFSRWRKANSAFCTAVEDAEARAVVGWLAKIEQAANQGAWQAAAWKLERRYPQNYGRTIQEQVHSGTVTQEHRGAIEVRAVDYRIAVASLLTDGADDGEEPTPLHPPSPNGKALPG